jgi:hypothetical protein
VSAESTEATMVKLLATAHRVYPKIQAENPVETVRRQAAVDQFLTACRRAGMNDLQAGACIALWQADTAGVDLHVALVMVVEMLK